MLQDYEFKMILDHLLRERQKRKGQIENEARVQEKVLTLFYSNLYFIKELFSHSGMVHINLAKKNGLFIKTTTIF
jgi:hypothetical protein